MARPGRSVVMATPACSTTAPAIADPIAPAALDTSRTLSFSRGIRSRRECCAAVRCIFRSFAREREIQSVSPPAQGTSGKGAYFSGTTAMASISNRYSGAASLPT